MTRETRRGVDIFFEGRGCEMCRLGKKGRRGDVGVLRRVVGRDNRDVAWPEVG